MEINLLAVHWTSWADFFAMGGYAFYVWGSFAVCVLLLFWECVQAKRNWAKELEELGQAYELESDLAQFRGVRS